jgi:magnesium and cobalt transporter
MNQLIRGHKKLITSSGLSKEELISAVEVGSDAGLDKISIKILKNLIAHIERPVTDIMIPRSEIQVIAIDEYWSVIEEFIKITDFSTVLFCRENIDNITGFALKIDLLNRRKKDIANVIMEPLYVPESKTIFSLLRDFKEQNNFMAVVLDEYGGTSGIVTFKDILDSIFIQDMRIKKLIAEKESGVWLVHGNTKISDLNNELQINLPTESNTVSGYIINMTGMIPSKGTILDIVQNYRIIVQKSDNKQVELLELKKIVK